MDRLNIFSQVSHTVQRATEHPLSGVGCREKEAYLRIVPEIARSDVRNETIQQLAMRLVGQNIVGTRGATEPRI